MKLGKGAVSRTDLEEPPHHVPLWVPSLPADRGGRGRRAGQGPWSPSDSVEESKPPGCPEGRSERPGLKHDLGGVCCSSSHLTRIGEDSSIRITFWVSSHTPLELFLPPETLSSSPRVRGSSLPLHPSSLSLTPTSRSSGHSRAGRVVFRVALEAETR